MILVRNDTVKEAKMPPPKSFKDTFLYKVLTCESSLTIRPINESLFRHRQHNHDME